jgi:hypothetical protein
MTHLPFIVASYAIAVVIPVCFGVSAQMRLAKARKRLAAVDVRRARS